MGFYLSKLFKLGQNKQVKLLLVGLDNAGKTTILYQIKMKETVKTIPTVGFNVEEIEKKGVNFTLWDIGGQDKIRILWKHYYDGMNGIIFVVDCNDTDRIDEAKDEIDKLLNQEELKGCPLLILANKQDIRSAMSPHDLTKRLELSNIKDRKWLVQGASAVSGSGLIEGFDWIADVLNKKK